MARKRSEWPPAIREAVEDSLRLLRDVPRDPAQSLTAGPLPSILDQTRELLSETKGAGRRPIGSIHHFACAGGTLISRCLSAMPNTSVLSEIDPLSTYGVDVRNPVFAPTDLLRHLRYEHRDIPEATVIAVYLSALETLHEELARAGMQIVIRDHSHSHFCTHAKIESRPTHLSILQNRFEIRPIVTVRDPVESYISLCKLEWNDFEPQGFDEYCRRYLRFLELHDTAPIFKYEAFVQEPGAILAEMCTGLGVDFEPGFEPLISAIQLTGDSGRKGVRIEPRPPKPRSETLEAEIAQSNHYEELKSRLGY